MKSQLKLFSHARTAMLHGLTLLNINKDDCVLIPDYICSVIPKSISEICQYTYYPIYDDFTPDWNKLNDLIGKKTKAIMMVHYFGQPQDIEKFQKFSKRYGLLLLEDNSHGHGGTYLGKKLGNFGDIGFSSPRKILRTNSGGILYLNSAITYPPAGMRRIQSSFIISKIRLYLQNFPYVKVILKKIFKNSPDYSDPYYFKEIAVEEFAADSFSEKEILVSDWEKISMERRNRWIEWSNFAVNNNLIPVYEHLYNESCAWALPVYAKDKEDRLFWFNWGAKKGYDVFPWPSLEEGVIEESAQCVKRWNHLLCLPLHQRPPK